MSETPTPKANDEVSRPCCDPASILASTGQAKTLTISDQHANILLDQSNSGEKALLKLCLVPFHKTELACLPPQLSEGNMSAENIPAQKELRDMEEREHSSKVLTFLSKFDWRMTSESGAEYSFHEAFPKAVQDATEVPAPKRAKIMNEVVRPSVFRAELIYPASERQISRAMPSPGLSLVHETPEVYKSVVKPFIDDVVASGSLTWLKNIVEVKKEQERLLWNAESWILNIDTKWRTHPDALTVPRCEWYKHACTADLYCLGIVKEDGVSTLRELRGHHIPLLREMLEQGPKVIEELYGVSKDQLRVFVHYQPQFYHFHVHFTRLENAIGVEVEKAHLLYDIIQDLEADPDCFSKKTLVYKLSLKEKLYQLVVAHREKEKTGNTADDSSNIV